MMLVIFIGNLLVYLSIHWNLLLDYLFNRREVEEEDEEEDGEDLLDNDADQETLERVRFLSKFTRLWAGKL